MRNEVGQLAADEAKPIVMPGASVETDSTGEWLSPLLFTEPQPPGRDVFSVYSRPSGRLLQIAYHAHRRERLFGTSILPTLVDLPADRAALWSIFDWSAIIPGGMKLVSQRLNAGDLGLTFADGFAQITIRQIAVAQLALQRLSLDGWIADQQKTALRYYVRDGVSSDTGVEVHHRELAGRKMRMHRRLRYGFMWKLPSQLITIALHDPLRDRLFLLHGSDESLLQQVAKTLGTV